MTPYLVKVKAYYDGQSYTEYLICYGKSFSEVSRRIEDYYEEDLESLQVTELAASGEFVYVTAETAKELVAGGGCQADGHIVLQNNATKM